MKYINKETKEIFDNPGEVRKALAPKKLPKVLTKAVLENNNFDYFYEVEPIVAVRQMNAFLFQGGLLFERLHRKREFQTDLI